MRCARTSAPTWWQQRLGAPSTDVVAYFCAEFALHQSLPIYAGGLGVLAGDHCKEASDLGVPLVGVGFMYPQGYFRQRISPEGWQQEHYEQIDWDTAPIERAQTVDGQPCVVLVPLGDRSVLVQVWQVRLGRVQPAAARHRPASRTRRGIANCRRGCTAADPTRGCSRKSCSAWAACWRCARSATRRPCGT